MNKEEQKLYEDFNWEALFGKNNTAGKEIWKWIEAHDLRLLTLLEEKVKGLPNATITSVTRSKKVAVELKAKFTKDVLSTIEELKK